MTTSIDLTHTAITELRAQLTQKLTEMFEAETPKVMRARAYGICNMVGVFDETFRDLALDAFSGLSFQPGSAREILIVGKFTNEAIRMLKARLKMIELISAQ